MNIDDFPKVTAECHRDATTLEHSGCWFNGHVDIEGALFGYVLTKQQVREYLGQAEEIVKLKRQIENLSKKGSKK